MVGKTNMDQFAAGLVGTRTPFGTARNAFDDRSVPAPARPAGPTKLCSQYWLWHTLPMTGFGTLCQCHKGQPCLDLASCRCQIAHSWLCSRHCQSAAVVGQGLSADTTADMCCVHPEAAPLAEGSKPWLLMHTRLLICRFIPGGSSSGSGSAVGRALVSFALGTDTAGSGGARALATHHRRSCLFSVCTYTACSPVPRHVFCSRIKRPPRWASITRRS